MGEFLLGWEGVNDEAGLLIPLSPETRRPAGHHRMRAALFAALFERKKVDAKTRRRRLLVGARRSGGRRELEDDLAFFGAEAPAPPADFEVLPANWTTVETFCVAPRNGNYMRAWRGSGSGCTTAWLGRAAPDRAESRPRRRVRRPASQEYAAVAELALHSERNAKPRR